jgi:hypothetical protein
LPDKRVALGQCQFGQVHLALAKLHQLHEVADIDSSFDTCHDRAWRGNGDVDTPCVGEQPFVAHLIDPGNHPWHAELGLGQQRRGEVHFVVPGRGDHHLARL